MSKAEGSAVSKACIFSIYSPIFIEEVLFKCALCSPKCFIAEENGDKTYAKKENTSCH
jgi:hypothetical protein